MLESVRMYRLNHTSRCGENSHNHKLSAWSLGTGQIHEAMRPMVDVCQTINCLHDAEWIFVTRKGYTNEDF